MSSTELDYEGMCDVAFDNVVEYIARNFSEDSKELTEQEKAAAVIGRSMTYAMSGFASELASCESNYRLAKLIEGYSVSMLQVAMSVYSALRNGSSISDMLAALSKEVDMKVGDLTDFQLHQLSQECGVDYATLIANKDKHFAVDDNGNFTVKD